MRHFLGLYLLIVLTLAAASWGQDKLLQAYGNQDSSEDRTVELALLSLQERLKTLPSQEWQPTVAAAATAAGVEMELFKLSDVAGQETLAKLGRGDIARMQASANESWTLKQIDQDYVLALKAAEPDLRRGALDWTLTLIFYAAIALVLMIWIWPLTRDLRALENAAAHFGNKQWRFEANIKRRSQIYPLAETFRRMAARIDGLIASHQDLSNAVSHEIKTPLARMQFEIELAQQAPTRAAVTASLSNIKSDISVIDALVKATLSYAILERADMSLNVGSHNFATLVPAIADHVRRDARPELRMRVDVIGDAQRIHCDMHLLETVLKNLLYNAARYANQDIHVTFRAHEGSNQLLVDDDGPGIPEKDRQRVFESFVQLGDTRDENPGFGLGLAIVKRIMEWHRGEVAIDRSPLGGARVSATWPAIFV